MTGLVNEYNIDPITIVSEAYQLCKDIIPARISRVYLYGSYARGDFDEESDIDILMTVDMSSEELRHYRNLLAGVNSKLSLKYNVTVSIVLKPDDQFDKFSSFMPYYQNVVREGVRYAV